MPPFDTRRIEQILPHVGGLHGDLATIARPRKFLAAHGPQRADHEFCRTLDLAIAGVFKEIRGEQRAQHRIHLTAGFPKRSCQRINRLGIPWRLDLPGRHLGFIGNEEIVNMACDKPVTSRLLHDNIDDIITVEIAGAAQESLFIVVVILWDVLEVPGKTTVRQARNLGLEGPTGERT